MLFRIILISALAISLYSCSKKDEIIYEPQKKISPYKLYEEAMGAFNKNDFLFASKKFNEAELNFGNIENAAKSAIMSAYSLYSINFYDEALNSLDNYLKIYLGSNWFKPIPPPNISLPEDSKFLGGFALFL